MQMNLYFQRLATKREELLYIFSFSGIINGEKKLGRGFLYEADLEVCIFSSGRSMGLGSAAGSDAAAGLPGPGRQ